MTGQTTLHDHDLPLLDRIRDSHADLMRRAFEEFDKANPRIWSQFVAFANEAIAAGVKTLGSKLIVERIRWDVMIQTKGSDGFKINNNFTPFYARKYMDTYPHLAGIFKTRRSAADENSPVTTVASIA